MLLDLLDGHPVHNQLLPVNLVVRGTTAPHP
jgi:DNA-binding LacI/PurR family transcriptional regulator